jgi:hypothetical protein
MRKQIKVLSEQRNIFKKPYGAVTGRGSKCPASRRGTTAVHERGVDLSVDGLKKAVVTL